MSRGQSRPGYLMLLLVALLLQRSTLLLVCQVRHVSVSITIRRGGFTLHDPSVDPNHVTLPYSDLFHDRHGSPSERHLGRISRVVACWRLCGVRRISGHSRVRTIATTFPGIQGRLLVGVERCGMCIHLSSVTCNI